MSQRPQCQGKKTCRNPAAYIWITNFGRYPGKPNKFLCIDCCARWRMAVKEWRETTGNMGTYRIEEMR